MAFDFSKLSFLQQYLTSNAWVLADVVFVVYALYNTIVHFRIGLIGTFFRFFGYVISYFASRWLTQQATTYLGLKDQLSLWMVAIALFVLISYIVYKNLRYLTPGPMSFIDSMIGAIYGVGEALLFLLILNTTCVYVHQNGFGVPDWVLVANGKKSETTKLEKPEILYSLVKLARDKGVAVLPASTVNTGFEWLKSQFTTIVTDLTTKTTDAEQQVQAKIAVTKPQ